MTRAHWTRVVSWTCAVLLVIVGRLAFGQETSAAKQPSTEQPAAKTSAQPSAEAPAETPVPEATKPAKKKESRGQLPAYYGQVVDKQQREKIYAIQGEYAPKIDALKAQLAALIAERDEKVAAVLTPEQLKTVEKLSAEAKAKRDSKKKEKPAAKSAGE